MMFKNTFKRVVQTGWVAAIALPLVVACADTPSNSLEVGEVDIENAIAVDEGLEAFEGQPITIYGEFQEQIGGTLFLIEEEGQKDLDEVLVVNQSDRSFAVPTDGETPIWAIGEVAPLALAGIDGLDASGLESLEGEPAVYAKRITLAPEPDDLSENADSYYDQDLTVFGVVEQVEAAKTFILEEPGLFETGGIIVIQTGDAAEDVVIEGDRVALSGTLRPYVIAELEEEYELTWDLDLQEQLEAEYNSVPVFIADTISPVEE